MTKLPDQSPITILHLPAIIFHSVPFHSRDSVLRILSKVIFPEAFIKRSQSVLYRSSGDGTDHAANMQMWFLVRHLLGHTVQNWWKLGKFHMWAAVSRSAIDHAACWSHGNELTASAVSTKLHHFSIFCCFCHALCEWVCVCECVCVSVCVSLIWIFPSCSLGG